MLAHELAVIGLGMYVWNATLSLEVVRLLKKLRPALLVVLGGGGRCRCREGRCAIFSSMATSTLA